MSRSQIIQNLKQMPYRYSVHKAMTEIEQLIHKRDNSEFAMDLITEIIFLETPKSIGNTKTPDQMLPKISFAKQFQLVMIMTEFFCRRNLDATRNGVFLTLFGGNLTKGRANILLQLITTSISTATSPVLHAIGTWMQQLGCTSAPACETVQRLINEYIVYCKPQSPQLKQLPLVAPRFAANFMTTVSDLYLNDLRSEMLIAPPDIILDLFTDWLFENQYLCFSALRPLKLPSGALAMSPSTPLAGLIRWTVLAPLINQGNRFNKLYSILLNILKIQPSIKLAAINAQDIGHIGKQIKNHAKILVLENINQENNENYKLSLQRYGQVTQIILASSFIFGNVPKLLCLLQTLSLNDLITY